MFFPGRKIQQTTTAKVAGMVSDSSAQRMAQQKGLAIQNVSWEDNSRNKGSCWGPCISDMTLQVDSTRLPVIRHPNFSDLTWDVAMDKIPLVVGNEHGGTLRTVSLKEYLQSFRLYLHRGSSWRGNNSSLHAPSRDSHVVVSAQSCFLPIEEGQETKFHVNLFNYQSTRDDPAVLAIVATSKGTSAQIVRASNQSLYFNNNGHRASFVAQRLKDNRREKGVAVEGAMNRQEKQDNLVMIIQVPLKKKAPARSFSFGFGGGAPPPGGSFGAAPNYKSGAFGAVGAARRKCDVDHAIVKVGANEGPFSEICDLEIERDTRYPVRVTLQLYKATSNGVINAGVVNEVATQIEASQKDADFLGSLVMDPSSWRPTESQSNMYSFFNQNNNQNQNNNGGFTFLSNSPVPAPAPAAAASVAPNFGFSNLHPGVNCDRCNQAVQTTHRFKCLQCLDYDLCAACEHSLGPGNWFHSQQHLFFKIRDSSTAQNNIHIQNRIPLQHPGVRCCGCSQLLRGVRYTCTECAAVDYCGECDVKIGHQQTTGHTMYRIVSSQHYNQKCHKATAPVFGIGV